MITPALPASQRPTVTFWGAAQCVTGSMHLVEVGDERILLDCGKDRTGFGRNRKDSVSFPFDPSTITAVVLSHAHIDHCGHLPDLVRHGFDGPIYCSPPTNDLLEVMLSRSARIQEDELRVDRLLNHRSRDPHSSPVSLTEEVLLSTVPVPYGREIAITDNVQLQLYDAGHILGSAMVRLRLDGPDGEVSLTFTGDLGRQGLPFLRDAEAIPGSDVLICESTYGGREHQCVEEMATTVREAVTRSANDRGVVLIPAFSLGRMQLVVHYLQRWMDEGTIPSLPIYVDSPQAADIAEIYDEYPEHLVPAAMSSPSKVSYIRERDESDDLVERSKPCIILASGGMCEGGRIVKHLRRRVDDPRASLLLVSYQAPDSLGRQMMDKSPTVRFHGRTWSKWIDVVELNGFSGHADQNEFVTGLSPLVDRIKKVRLVHGDLEQSRALAERLAGVGFRDVDIPAKADTTTIE